MCRGNSFQPSAISEKTFVVRYLFSVERHNLWLKVESQKYSDRGLLEAEDRLKPVLPMCGGKAGEEAAGAGEVAGNLGAEGVRRGEFAFVAETLPEVNFHWSGRNNL